MGRSLFFPDFLSLQYNHPSKSDGEAENLKKTGSCVV